MNTVPLNFHKQQMLFLFRSDIVSLSCSIYEYMMAMLRLIYIYADLDVHLYGRINELINSHKLKSLTGASPPRYGDERCNPFEIFYTYIMHKGSTE